MMRRGLLLVIIIALFIPVKVFSSDYAEYLPKWLELLKKGNDDEKKVALHNLWFLEYPEYRKDIKVFDPILDALKDKNPYVREAAADCLKRIGDYSKGCCKETKIVPSLIDALEDRNPGVRQEAAKALGYYKDKRAVEPLIDLLKDKDPWVRFNAVSSLRELGAKQAVDALLDLLESNSGWPDKLVQQECVLALRNGGININKVKSALMKHFNEEYLKADIIITLGIFQAEETRDLIIAATKDSNERIRKLALEAMSRLPRDSVPTKIVDVSTKEKTITLDDSQIDIYIKSIKDPSPEVRIQSIEKLKRSENIRAVGPLMEALNDNNEKVRLKAMMALGNFADERIFDAIIKHVIADHDMIDFAVRTYKSVAEKTSKERVYIFEKEGVRYITKNYSEIPKDANRHVRIIHPSAVNKLLSALDSSNSDITLTILNLIMYFEDHRIEEYLVKFFNDPSSRIRQRVASLLSYIGTDISVPKLIESLKDNNEDVRKEAALALGTSKDKRALEPLIESLNDTDDNVRAAALRSLGKFDDLRIADVNLKMLQDKAIQVRWNAIYNISTKPDKRAAVFLIPLLNDLNYDLIPRANAAKALGSIRDKKAVPELIKIVANQKEDLHMRSTAAISLGRIGDSSAVNPLIKILKGEADITFRRDVAKALSLIGDKKAISALIEIVSDQKEDLDMRNIAAISLRDIGDSSALEAFNNFTNEITFHFPQKETVYLKPLISSLKDNNPKIRRETADKLGDIGDNEAIRYLIPLLKDKNEYVRQAAARALGKLKDKDAVEPLINTLSDPDINVKAFSVWALGEINDSRAVEPLAHLLLDKEEKIRNHSFEALRKFKDPPVNKIMVNTLIEGAKSNTNNAEMQAEGILWKLISLEGNDIILKTLEDPQGDNAKTVRNYIKLIKANIHNVSDITRKALKNYNDRTSVIAELSNNVKNEEEPGTSIALLGELQDSRCLPILLYAIKNKNSYVKSRAINAIGNLGDEETASVILDVLSDPKEHPGTRDHAARALGKLGDKKAMDLLINILKNTTENKDVRVGSAVALGSIRDKRAVEPLLDVFKNNKEDIWLRVAAASALGDIGDERAIKPLEEKIEDPSGYLKHAVEIALRKFNKGSK